MRLGNSGGNNTGKKYIKLTGSETITPENQARYNAFSEWIANNYSSIISSQKTNYIHDTDVMNNTYIKIGQNILYGGLIVSDYAAYFSRAYYTNHILNKVTPPSTLALTDDDNIECFDVEYDNRADSLMDFSLKYIKSNMPEQSYCIFEDYFYSDNKYTYRSLAKKYCVSLHHVSTIIHDMVNLLKSNKHISENYGY